MGIRTKHFFCVQGGLLVILLSIFACKNDGEITASNDVAGKWRLTSITVLPAQNGVTDLLGALQAFIKSECPSKIVLNFKTGGGFAAEYPSECSGTGQSYIEDGASWKVENGRITITEGTDINQYELSFNKKQMLWTYSETKDNINYKYTITFNPA